jgi:hypothetical protein
MKFTEWADEQFGREPGPEKSLSELWEIADTYRRLLRITEEHIKIRENWINERKAALYAWNIKDKEKK